jgi:hypothetical protein
VGLSYILFILIQSIKAPCDFLVSEYEISTLVGIKVKHVLCKIVPAGELKAILSMVTGLEQREQRLLFRGKEREDGESATTSTWLV